MTDVPPSGACARSLGFVPQEAFLFSRTLRDNIALGRPDADGRGRSPAAVALARLEGDLDGLPAGLDTVGRRARLHALRGPAPARRRSPARRWSSRRILVLDDALSSVDADTERAILDATRAAPRRPDAASSSPIGCPPSPGSTASSCSRTAASSRTAPTTRCSRGAASTRACSPRRPRAEAEAGMTRPDPARRSSARPTTRGSSAGSPPTSGRTPAWSRRRSVCCSPERRSSWAQP